MDWKLIKINKKNFSSLNVTENNKRCRGFPQNTILLFFNCAIPLLTTTLTKSHNQSPLYAVKRSERTVKSLKTRKLSSKSNWQLAFTMLIENMDSLSSLVSIRRHYKKDLQYLNNLYTLTYDTSLYTSNELFSSLHNTIHRNDIEEQNVSFPISILWYIFTGERKNNKVKSHRRWYSQP